MLARKDTRSTVTLVEGKTSTINICLCLYLWLRRDLRLHQEFHGAVFWVPFCFYYIFMICQKISNTTQISDCFGCTIVYQHIETVDDTNTLQNDLDSLLQWEAVWGMSFHSKKFHHSYNIRDHTLEKVAATKYRGVTLSKDMSWIGHIETVTAKAQL